VILPTKGLATDRALLSVGGEVLRHLERPKSISRLWEQMRSRQNGLLQAISYDWFLLAVDLLYTVGAVNFEDGLLRKSRRGREQ